MRGDFGLGGEIAEWFGFGRSNGCPGIHAEVPLELDLKLCKTLYWQVEITTFPKIQPIHCQSSQNDVFYQVHDTSP